MGFQADIDKFVELSKLRPEQVRRGVAIRLFGAVIDDTPVLTGRLRANWRLTGRTPARGVTNKTKALSSAQVTSVVLSIKDGNSIILTNNLPYVARIEYDGWSHTKAPAGMVRLNVAKFEKVLKQEVRKRKL